MPQKVGTVTSELILDTRRATQEYQRFERTVNRNRGRDNFMSSISADAKDFDNSLGKATNRVVAFGAAAAVFGTLAKGAAEFASSIVEIDNSLAKINVNLGQSQAGLKKFGADLFNIARQTGQTFEVTAKAAEELARQGLSAEETTKRLKDSLVLSRIAGLDAATSVETLTAAINSFNEEALTSTEIVNKFAAVDTKFAVSSKDLAEAVSRVGSTAQSAGVGIDQLIGLVTSLQQTTARGGATIGNGLKTIFTRIQAAPETVAALEGVGVAIKNTDGSLRDALSILRDYGQAREKVGEVERAALDRTVAGTFQINILKAALTDLNKEYSVYGNAVRTSAEATDEAVRKNEKLNETISSLINSTGVSIKQLFASIGGEQIGPHLQVILKAFERIRSFFSGDSGSDLGKSLGDGLLQGITNVLSGPALGAITLILFQAFGKVIRTIAQEARTLLSLNSAAQSRAVIQKQINDLLGQATAAEQAQYAAASSVLAKKEQILAIQARINQESLVGNPLTRSFQVGANFPSSLLPGATRVDPRLGRGGSYLGGVPGFAADPISAAINREVAAGAPAGQVYVDRDARVASFANPMGLLVANRRDEPLGGYQGVNRVLSQGGNPKTNGIPGFANKDPLRSQAEIIARRFGINTTSDAQRATKAVSAFEAALIRSAKTTQKLADSTTKQDKASSALTKELFNLGNSGNVTGFKTALGSEYELNALGQTSRLKKSPGAGQGTKYGFMDALFLSHKGQKDIEAGLSLGDRIIIGHEHEGKLIQARSLADIPHGAVPEVFSINRDTNEARARAKGFRRPAVGLAPFEIQYQGDEKTIHLGNQITELTQSAASAKGVTAALREQNRISQKNGEILAAQGKLSPLLYAMKGNKTFPGPASLYPPPPRPPPTTFSLEGDDLINRQVDYDTNIAPGLARQRLLSRAQKIAKFSKKGADARRQALAKIEQDRRRRSDRTLGAAFIAPFIGGFAEPIAQSLGVRTGGGTPGGIVTGAISSASQFAGFGALTGNPVVAGGAAALGALVGIFSKLTKSSEELGAELDDEAAKRNQEAEAISRVRALREQLKDAQDSGENPAVIRRLNDRLISDSGKVTSVKGQAVLNAAPGQAQDEAQRQYDAANDLKDAARNIADLLAGRAKGRLSSAFAGGFNKDILSSLTPDKLAALRQAGSGTFDVKEKKGKVFGEEVVTNQSEVDKANADYVQAVQDILPILTQFGIGIEDITKGNLKDLSQELVRGALQFRKTAQDAEKQKDQSKGLSKTAFLNAPNLDVFTQAGLVGRTPSANNNKRAQTRLDFFNELSSNGGISKEILEGNKDFKQARAGVQSQNLTDSAIRFLESNNPNLTGKLRDAKGNPYITGIQRQLGLVAGAGTSASPLAKLFVEPFNKLNATLKETGTNQIGQALVNGPNFSSGFTPGIGYSTFAGSGKRSGGPASFYKDASSVTDNTQYYRSGGAYTDHTKYDLTQGPPSSQDSVLAAKSQAAHQTAASRDADIDAYLKIAEDVKIAAQNVTQASAQVAKQALSVIVTVNGAVDPALITAMQASIQQLFDQQAASSGRPNPPAPVPVTRTYGPQ